MSASNGNFRLAYARIWHEISGRNQVLGRLAFRCSQLLMGKHKPIFHPGNDCGDYVVVKECDLIHVTGKKMEKKLYYKHSKYVGNLKIWTMQELKDNKGMSEVFRRAVWGMLPRNRLRKTRMSRLKLFDGTAHPYNENILKTHITSVPELPVNKWSKRSLLQRNNVPPNHYNLQDILDGKVAPPSDDLSVSPRHRI